MTYLVGLTGGIGCGKSTVAARFVESGSGLIDADAVSHALTRREGTGWLAIREEFGEGFFRSDGELDRARLRQAVFADVALKTRLEAALHPLIRAETTRLIAASSTAYVLLMVPLLLETGRYRERCQRVLVIDCPESTQVQRVVARSGMAPAEVHAIIRTQIGRAQRLALADDIIDNAGAPDRAAGPVGRLDRLYRRLAKE
jgi:dephospho-CoA kinase